MNAIVEKTNRGKYLAAVFAMFMVLAGAVIVLSDNGVDAAAGETTYIHGGINPAEQPQEYTAGAVVIVDGDLTIPEKATLKINGAIFTVQEGYTVTIEEGGALILDGNSIVAINGTIDVDGGVFTNNVERSTVATDKTGVTVSGSVIVEGEGAQITGNGDLFVKSGATVEINDGAKIAGIDIILDNNASMTYNGITDTTGFYVKANVSGDYYASAVAQIKGAETTDGDLSDITFTVTSKNISGYTWDAENERAVSQTIRQYTLGVDGTVDNKETLTFTADNKLSQKYFTSADYAEAYNGLTPVEYRYDAIVDGIVAVADLDVENNAVLVNKAYMNVTGNVSIADDSKKNAGDAGKVTNTGIVAVAGSVSMDAISLDTGGEMGTIAINGGTVTIADGEDIVGKNYLYGAYYVDADDVMHISALDAALAGAVTAEVDEVEVYATIHSENNDYKVGGYVVSGELEIPAGIELNVYNGLVVAGTMTVNADAGMKIGSYGHIYVDGKVVDNSRDLAKAESDMTFEVKIVEGEGRTAINTYTTLATALNEVTEGTIYLYNNVTVEGTMKIPAGVTVTYDDEVANGDITLEEKATLNVNGTLVLTGNHKLVCTAEDATVNANNVIKTADEDTNVSGDIAGAHFNATLGEDDVDYDYITSVAYAAENSAEINGTITVEGAVAMGDVTFTKGEDNELIVSIENDYVTDEKSVATGNITLANGPVLNLIGAFTGTVNADVTAGATTVTFDKAYGAQVAFDSEETVESTITEMILGNATDADTVAGKTTVTAGEVTVATAAFDNLAIASGAVMDVTGTLTVNAADVTDKVNTIPKEFPVYTEQAIESLLATLTVDGTLNIDERATLAAAVAVIDGIVEINERATDVTFEGVVVNGAINNASTTPVNASITLVNGTIAGESRTDALIAYPGSTLDTEEISGGNAEATVFYINGEEYATMYAATTNVPVYAIMLFADVPGVQPASAVFYSDAAMTQPLVGLDIGAAADKLANDAAPDFSVAGLLKLFGATSYYVGTYDNIYIAMDPAEVEGTVSVGTGLDLYIDNVRVTGGQDFVLSVGTHTVSFDVKAGYDGANATITFNGQTVQNGGSITITADMTEYTLVASGAAPSQGQVVIDQTGGDDGMGITDYLLIILVILVIILAIFVALRMMRS